MALTMTKFVLPLVFLYGILRLGGKYCLLIYVYRYKISLTNAFRIDLCW